MKRKPLPGKSKNKKQVYGFLTAILISAFVGPAIHAGPISIYSEYKKKVSAIDAEDPASQVTMAMWCLDQKMTAKYAYHYGLFLKSRGANKRKKNPDGYCRTCNGEEEYICDVCSEKRLVSIECPGCKGTGKKSCPRCKGTGRLTCPRCGGTGIYRKKGGVSTGANNCPKTIECNKCRGKGFRKCNSCRGKGTKKVSCPVCNKYRFRKCAECAEWRKKFKKRIQESCVAVPGDTDRESPGKKKMTAPPEDLGDLDDLGDLGGDSLAKKADSLMAEGLALDKQAITADAPYPIVKKAESKYERAIKCYKAAQKKGIDVDVRLREALRMLFWVRKLMPVR